MDEARARELLAAARERMESSLSDLAAPLEDGEPAQSLADQATQLHDREVDEATMILHDKQQLVLKDHHK